MPRDLLGEAREIARELDGARPSGWEEEVENVIQGGSTGSEILMGLRWVMGRVRKSGAGSAALDRRVRGLGEALDAALGGDP